MNNVGRPSSYTPEIADKICEQIATSNKGLNAICKQGEMPCPSTVYLWLNLHKEFSEKYTRAREMQADLLADEIIELADTEKRTTTYSEGGEGGKFVTDQDNPARTRLQIDARKWKASKLAPKKYGDRLDLTSGGDKIIAPSPLVVYNTAPPLAQSESEVETPDSPKPIKTEEGE